MSGRALRALLGIPGAFALGALAERALLAHAAPHAPSVVATALNQPLVVATAWGRLGIDAVAILVATVVAGALVLLVAIRSGALEGEAREVRPAILLAAGLGLALALAWPLVFSSDVYAYAAYGDLALRGIDPFGAAPAALADPILEAARLQWSGAFPPCVYGPLSLVPALALVGVFGPAAPGAVLFGLRACAALAFLGSIPLAERALATAEDGTRRSPLLAAYACNPAALWAVAEGHNDAFLLLALLGGLAALRSGRSLAGGLLLGLGPLLKAPGLALGAAALFFGTAASWRRTVALRGFAVSAVPASALALVATLPALHALAVGGRYTPLGSLAALAGTPVALCAALAVLLLGLARFRGGFRDAAAYLGIALWLGIPNPYPWYALWVLPAAILAVPSAAAYGLWAVTIAAVLRYLPDAAGTISPQAADALAFAMLAPLAAALLALGRAVRRPAALKTGRRAPRCPPGRHSPAHRRPAPGEKEKVLTLP